MIWQPKNTSLLLGDCMTLLPALPDKRVEATITDIPYNEVMRKTGRSPNNPLRQLAPDRTKVDKATFEINPFVDAVVRVTRGSWYVFCGTEQISDLIRRFRYHGLTTRLCAWDKPNPAPSNGQYLWLSGLEFCVFARAKGAIFNEHCKKGLWPAPIGKSKRVKTEKPVSLFERLVLASTDEGHTVLDPCAGSGTTGVACLKHRREFIGMENDPDAWAIAMGDLTNGRAA